jgi:NADH:ubiquinone oxidoreductase subunit H
MAYHNVSIIRLAALATLVAPKMLRRAVGIFGVLLLPFQNSRKIFNFERGMMKIGAVIGVVVLALIFIGYTSNGYTVHRQHVCDWDAYMQINYCYWE